MKITLEPMLGIIGLSGGEIILILIVMLTMAFVIGVIILCIWLVVHASRKNHNETRPLTPSPVVQPPPVTRQCPKCGSVLKSDAPEGLCPACLLQHGFATEGGAPPGTPPFTPPPLAELAKLFPQLEILEAIGQGGMGAVYKARQPALDRFVALKILAPRSGGDVDFAGRFSREARALAKLSHPNIVAVYDYGQVQRSRRREEAESGQGQATAPPDVGGYEGDLNYFIMEFVDGPNLRQVEQAGKLSPREALEIIPQICAALQFAHDEGIVHRDIKPENVLLDKKGRVKIADFGLAKILGQDADFRLTGARDVMGTPHYMAPEQVEKPQEVDHRADIYSLGVVFYEMLTGELPIGKFDPPSHKVQIDVRLDDVVLRSLANNPDRRYQHVSEVKTELDSIAESPTRVVPIDQGVDYRSNATLFGLPLLHITSGLDPETGKARVSKGIIAIGGRAQGVVAIGGFAVGGIAFGGGAIGLIAFGGAALGLFSFGGLAIALMLALGGGAVAPIALGGGALGYLALGGLAVGPHVLSANIQDPAAQHFFGSWGRLCVVSFPVICTLIAVLAIGVGVIASFFARRYAKSSDTSTIVNAIRSWLTVMDHGDYARSWELAAPLFQRMMKKQDWVAKGESIRRPLGFVLSRQLSQTQFLDGGNKFHAEFETALENMAAAVETVTFVKQPSGDWKAVGYLIKPSFNRIARWLLVPIPALFIMLIPVAALIFRVWGNYRVAPNGSAPMPTLFSRLTHTQVSVVFHYQVFECDASSVEAVIPSGQRQAVVLPKGEPHFMTVTNGLPQRPNAQYAIVDLKTFAELEKPATAEGSMMVDIHRTIFSSFWNSGMADTWGYARSPYLGGAGGTLAVREVEGRLQMRVNMRVNHEESQAGVDKGSLNSQIFYEGPAPEEGALVFLIPFIQRDRSEHYLIVVYRIANAPGDPASSIESTEPKSTTSQGKTNAPRVLLKIRHFAANSPTAPTVDYTAIGPADYALLPVVSSGGTVYALPGPPQSGQYQATWNFSASNTLFSGTLDPRTNSSAVAFEGKFDTAELRATQSQAIRNQLQALQDEGWLTVLWGESKLLFSFTNASGNISQGFLRLVKTSSSGILSDFSPPSPDATFQLSQQPPVAVETFPVSGARDVPAGETEIRVRFSKPMQDGSWSWINAWENSVAESIEAPHYLADGHTCVMKVRLEPGHTYAWWLNSDKFHNFMDQTGHSAVPYLLIFQTKPN